MKLCKFTILLSVFIMSALFLTACGNDTSYVSDQTGKTIPVTSSDSDTYTFKLPTAETEETDAPVITAEPEITVEEPEEAIEEKPLADEGPKTGEP